MRARIALALVLCLSLVMVYGAVGSSAAFTSQATAAQNLSVGTFDLTLTSQTTGAVISNGGKTITYTVPAITASAASSAPLVFTVTSTGTIPMLIHLTQSGTALTAPFSSLLGAGSNPIADFTLTQNQSHQFAAGVAWTELTNADLGKSVTIVYTIAGTEVASGPQMPPLNARTWVGQQVTIYVHTVQTFLSPPTYYTVQPGDTLELYLFGSTNGWWPSTCGGANKLATADAGGNLYWQGNVPAGTTSIQVTVCHGGAINTWYPTPWNGA